MRAKDVVRPIAEQALGTGVPTGHVSGWIEHENRIVLHPFHEQAEAFLALLQGLLSALAFADVTEGQHNAGDVPGNVPDWRGAVVDGCLDAGAGDQDGAIGQADNDAFT